MVAPYLTNGFFRLFALGFQFGGLLVGQDARFAQPGVVVDVILHLLVVSSGHVALLLGFSLSRAPFGQNAARFVHSGLDRLADPML